MFDFFFLEMSDCSKAATAHTVSLHRSHFSLIPLKLALSFSVSSRKYPFPCAKPTRHHDWTAVAPMSVCVEWHLLLSVIHLGRTAPVGPPWVYQYTYQCICCHGTWKSWSFRSVHPWMCLFWKSLFSCDIYRSEIKAIRAHVWVSLCSSLLAPLWPLRALTSVLHPFNPTATFCDVIYKNVGIVL